MSLSSLAAWFLWAALCYEVVLAANILQVARSRNKDPDFREIKIWLWCLLRNGYDGENVLFRDKRHRRFIRFQKYTDDSGAPGIELTFPEIAWGKELVPRLRAYAEQKGLTFRASDENEPDYAHVKLGDDIGEAFALCQVIWHRFYGFTPQAPYLRQIGDLSDINELVDIAVQSQLSDAESKQRWNRYLNARLEHTGQRWLQAKSSTDSMPRLGGYLFVSAVGFLAALVGLPVSTLLTLGDPPSWQLELGPIGLQGSNTSLVFFFVYLFSFEVIRRCMRSVTINRRKMTRIELVFHAPKHTVLFAIPISVVLVWLGI